ncbi:MAG: hypothetical protein Q7J09_07370 [Methanocalculus sp.]|uniref:hypothetical protein n=1 Tax=Methanocalculus sp. TaxID=2004547 RepID=UPI002726D928|nr:hypothetical protein [Methanocalculus sp.]MDO9539804.1 hypothetical protein [Methanocalculus sp.]
MAFANLIGAVVGIFLLLLVAYLLVGATLLTAETVMAAQRDMTEVHSTILSTSISINSAIATNETLSLIIKNDGNTIIDPKKMDVYTATSDSGHIRKDWVQGNITPDGINPGLFDPGEYLNMTVDITGYNPTWVKVVTPNGIAASTYL